MPWEAGKIGSNLKSLPSSKRHRPEDVFSIGFLQFFSLLLRLNKKMHRQCINIYILYVVHSCFRFVNQK